MIGEMFFLGPSAAHLHALAESLRGRGFVVRSPGWLDTGLWGLTAYCHADQLGPYPWARLDALATEHGTDLDDRGPFRGSPDHLIEGGEETQLSLGARA